MPVEDPDQNRDRVRHDGRTGVKIIFLWPEGLQPISLNPAFPETCTQEPVSPVPLIDLENGNIKVH